MNNEQIGTVYFVSTPIGNLEDISLRALNVLKSVDFIACEDTRHSLKLLNHFCIAKPLIAYHKFNEMLCAQKIIDRVQLGESCAIISDAGTPLLSDPGNVLVHELVENCILFFALPGANACLPALIYSGFDVSRFAFYGFLSDNKNIRKNELQSILNEDKPCVIYLPPHDCLKILAEINHVDPQRRLSLSKEITKIHETTFRGTAEDISALIGEEIKGEFVLITDGKKFVEKYEYSDSELVEMFEKNTVILGKKEALKQLSQITGIPKRELYDKFMK